MNFANVKTWTIQEGEVIVVKDSNNSRIIWQKQTGPDYSEPFYVENISNSTETLEIVKYQVDAPTITIEKSTDGQSWGPFGTTSTTALSQVLQPGSKLYLRASTNRWSIDSWTNANIIKGCSKVGGNIMSLLYGSGFNGTEINFPGNTTNQFDGLFHENSNLITASALLLPATTLKSMCYSGMFGGCTSLVNAPALPATNLAERCYGSMFGGCTSLVNAPILPANNMQFMCYSGMFDACASLVNAPALPATNLAERCYDAMFQGCASLVNAPALPATNLAERCYGFMFNGCTSLISAPVLSSTNLADYCYRDMFRECTSLVNAPALPATNLMNYCYFRMFQDCTSITVAPLLSASVLVEGCYREMFYKCTLLNYVECMAVSGINTNNSTLSWLYNVSATGTFTKAAGVTWPSGASGIPSGWTVQ